MTRITDRIRNGVDAEQLLGTAGAIKTKPELGQFQFRCASRWVDGARTTSEVGGHVVGSDLPETLAGGGTAPNPVEHLLHAVGSCLTTAIVYLATARGIALTEVEASLEGEMDVRGALGLSAYYRSGFDQITIRLHIVGDAPEETLEELVADAQERSPVFDMLTNGVPVATEIEAG